MANRMRVLIDKLLPSGGFARNVATLMTGTTFAQAVIILASPFLTRLYDPGSFGVFALYTSILTMLSVVACWRYELSIVLPEKDDDAANLLLLSCLICLGMSVTTFIIVLFGRTAIAGLLGSHELSFWLLFMPLSLVLAGFLEIFNFWSTRRKQFKRLAVRSITLSTVTNTVQLGAGALIKPGAAGLIGGSLFGSLFATGKLVWQVIREDGKTYYRSIKKEKIIFLATKYKDFPLYFTWSSVLKNAAVMMPVLLLGMFFNPVVVGYYALGYRVLVTPSVVIGNAVAQVFISGAADAKRDNVLDQLTFEVFQNLLSIGFVPILLLSVVAPDLFALVFGSTWYEAGLYVRWMGLWILFQFVSSPLTMIFMVLDKQKQLLFFNITLVLIWTLALVIGGQKSDIMLSIKLLGISGAVMYLAIVLQIAFLAGIRVSNVVNAILKELLRSLPYISTPFVFYYIFDNSLTFILSAIGAGIVFLFIKFRGYGKPN